MTSMMRSAGGWVLSPICVVAVTPAAAYARDNIWSSAPMSARTSDLAPDLTPAAGVTAHASALGPTINATAAAAPIQSGAHPLDDAGAPATHALPRPAASAAGWDIYAAVSINAASERVGKATRQTVGAVPEVFLLRDLGASRLALHGFVALPFDVSNDGRAIQSSMRLNWTYKPANDAELDLGIEGARLSGDLLSPDRGFRPVNVFDGLQNICGIFRNGFRTCERVSIGARLQKRTGALVISAKATAAAARWQPERWSTHAQDSLFSQVEMRIAGQVSHRFEPYVEGSMNMRRDHKVEGGRNRLVTGVFFPELSLFSARIYGGIDAAGRAPLLPVIGGALSWSPRRTILLGIRAEISAADNVSGMLFNTTAPDPFPASWQAGRQYQTAGFLRWSLTSTLDINLGVGWSQAHWRRQDSYGAGRTENYSDVTAAVAWAMAPQWLVRLDVAALRSSGSGIMAQRQIVAAVSLRKAL